MDFAFAVEAQKKIQTISVFKRFIMVVLGRRVYIGHEQRNGWSGRLPFYLFWCSECEHFAKSYKHGYVERQYLICSHCEIHHSCIPWWVAWVQIWELIYLGIFLFMLKNKNNRV